MTKVTVRMMTMTKMKSKVNDVNNDNGRGDNHDKNSKDDDGG